MIFKKIYNLFISMMSLLKRGDFYFSRIFLVYIFKKIDLLINAVISPQHLIVVTPIILAGVYHQNIIDTITGAQAKILLQKEHLDPLQYQITETWAAANALVFLFTEYSRPGENSKKFKNKIPDSYDYWLRLSKDWKKNWKNKFNENMKKVKEEEKEALQKQFDNIVEYFEDNFFNKINVCYNNYYSENESCAAPTSVLPLPANTAEFQRKIYQFYVNVSTSKK